MKKFAGVLAGLLVPGFIVAGVIALISFIKFGAGRVNKEEAIHITQQ